MQRKSETNWCKSPVLSSFLIFYLGCFRKTSVKFFTPWYLATLKDNIETVLSNESNTNSSHFHFFSINLSERCACFMANSRIESGELLDDDDDEYSKESHDAAFFTMGVLMDRGLIKKCFGSWSFLRPWFC